jgi:DNA-binding protein YbaB
MSLIDPQPPLEGSAPMTLDDDSPKENKWIRIARQIYEGSTEYVDANLRYQWEKSLSMFNNKHPSGSKYLTGAYEKRSRFFRPKTRSAVRSLQSAMSVAFFTNEDVVSIEPANANDPQQAAAAVVAQSIMQYRLTNTIPWFQIMTAAIQDAAVQGVCISHQYWDFEEKEETYVQVDGDNEPLMDEEGNEQTHEQITTLSDHPVIELISPENIRIDPASDWANPIESSPYIVHLIPMFLQDVRIKIKSGEWKEISDEELLSSAAEADTENTTRLVRDEPRMDPLENTEFGEIRDFWIIWVHKNVVKRDGVDYCYFTAGTDHLLTDPKPLSEMYPWLRDGERPYVMGCVNIEAHKIYPSGTVELTQELQSAANDIWNQRFDNVKLAMNKRYHIRRDRNIDLDALFRSVPGGAVEMDDPDTDVRVIETRDVTGSAYAEQDRINMDFDELQGNFSTSTVQGARSLNETVGGMNLLAGSSGQVAEYTLRTFADTWVQNVLKQLLRLEQYYETDPVILAVAGQEAQQRKFSFNVDDMMDELLRQEVLLKVNVGINATDPVKKVQNLLFGVQTLAAFPGVPESLNLAELAKEVFGQLGYKDGTRFVTIDKEQDPQVQQLQQQLQELQQMLETDQAKAEAKVQLQQVKNEGATNVAQIRSQSDIERELIQQDTDIREAEIRHQDAVTRRGELMLQRDALLNQMSDKEMERELELRAGGKAGTLSRDKYNKVPFAVG